ncbi:hypothetical protein [Desulfosporosinus sp. Sb-LF]|uniref:hypothetical protein n=1 Tax=Desulfosporosinus sp. Sb-LF TaxID=2560027 RepID=UPI001FB052E8|nr:hypothetical protein [Desulfosporosinus sp. Sb-LF]
MMERLNNDQIAQRILDANSDLKRYLNLAPSLNKPAPSQPKTTVGYFQRPISTTPFHRPLLRPLE